MNVRNLPSCTFSIRGVSRKPSLEHLAICGYSDYLFTLLPLKEPRPHGAAFLPFYLFTFKSPFHLFTFKKEVSILADGDSR